MNNHQMKHHQINSQANHQVINKKLSNEDLLSTVRSKASHERQLTVEIIELLQEVADRDLHLKMGYGSLLKFCIEELKYSESAAYRRISAVRLVKDVPSVKQALANGDLTLQAATQAQTFLNQERKYLSKTYTPEQKQQLVQEIKHKSSRQVEQYLASKSPELPRPEASRQIQEDKREVKLTVCKQLDHKLDQLKSRYSHKNQNPTMAELLELMADELLQKSKRHDAKPAPVKSANPRSISKANRNYIRARDNNKCVYKDPDSGKTCGSQHLLEIDHIVPVALNGTNDIANLRLVCRSHNQMFAKQIPYI